MKTLKFILSLSIILLIVLSACRKEENSSVGFTMKATDANATANVSTSQEPSLTNEGGPSNDVHLQFTWNEGWIYITSLEFNAQLIKPSVGLIKEDPYIHIEWQGNQKVDLFGEPKIFANLEIPDGQYQNIELRFTSSRINDMASPNFYFAGIYGPVFGGTPISVAVSQEFTIDIKFENGTINVQSGNILDGQIDLCLDNLFTGISSEDLEKAELTNGWILISSTHNQVLYVKILANLQAKLMHEEPSSLAWYFHIQP